MRRARSETTTPEVETNKTTRRTGLGISLVFLVAALLVSWLTQGTGVVRNDLARNIYIPDGLTMPL